MNLLALQKMFEIHWKQTTFFRIINENIGRRNLLVFKFTKRFCLVHDGIDVWLLDRKDFSNPMLYLRIPSLQNNLMPIFHHRKEGTSLNLHGVDQF